jgi:hypothetical protein
MVLCDEIWTDAVSTKKSLIGVFEGTWARRYPAIVPRFCIFAELLGFIGQLPLAVRLYRRSAALPLDEVSSHEVVVYSTGMSRPEAPSSCGEIRGRGASSVELAGGRPVAVSCRASRFVGLAFHLIRDER